MRQMSRFIRSTVLPGALLLLVVLVVQTQGTHAQDAQKKRAAHRAFGLDCGTCHTSEGWKALRTDITFDHTLTGFALAGRHTSVTCDGCHAKIAFKDLSRNCVLCHADRHKGEFGDRCQDCHTPAGWRNPNKDVARHQYTRFPLFGAHLSIACENCHTNQQEKEFRNTPADCFACHSTDYAQSKQPDHQLGGFDHNCVACHNLNNPSWRGSFVHPSFDFMRTAAHTALACAQCHTTGYKGTPSTCFGCHEKDYNTVTAPNHLAGQFDHDCTVCHDPVKWKPARFNHALTAFPLRGAHAATPCNKCHTSGYSKLPTECWTCHQQQYESVTFPSHVQGQFSHDCTTCHSMDAWKPAQFSHDNTNFRLTGAHLKTECQRCHVGGQYKGLPLECQGCHATDYQQTTRPNHGLVGFTQQCADCHNTTAWQPVERMPLSIDHDRTRFPLTGAHRQAQCTQCHVNLMFGGTPMECFACHQKDYTATRNPDHAAGQFDHDCTTCHTTNGWKPANFDHARTAFPLAGRHTGVACERCHVAGDYTIRYSDCWQCHQTDFQQVKQPDHQAAQFTHDCTRCHTVNGWKPATFDHATTKFPLVGAHATRACQDCHKNGQYTGLATDCWSCHQQDFNAVQTPSHLLGQFTHDCTVCHGNSAWKPSTFNHASTSFPLEGAHAAQPCQACHANGQYSNLPTDCWSCHQKDFNAVQTPSHLLGQFTHDCTVCHGKSAWKPSTFNHASTKFPLDGAHAAQPCQACHVNGQYANLPTDCWSCHQKDFNAVQTPSHLLGQFPHDCTACHGKSAWKPSTFNHAGTKFPLQGAHATRACQDCHKNGQYTSMPTDCWSCHQQNYTGVTQPNHVQGQFNHDCTYCHGSTAWKPTTLDHNKTGFPLTGRHLAVACEQCHKNGQYGTQLPTDCYSCHQTDFQNVKAPDHALGQFPHDCVRCHSTAGWKPSSFDHNTTKFRLAGAHAAQPCQACHTNGNYNLTYTDCWQCHQSDFASAQSPSHLASQLPHDCTTCHSLTSWRPSTFDHARTLFPLEGAHRTLACEKCHVAGNYSLKYTDCYQCHQQDYQSVKTPNHVTGSFSHNCTVCHSSTAWKPSQVDHNQTHFPLTGKHATAACEACHINGNYNLTYTDCKQCHASDFSSVKNPDHVAGKFPNDCALCHTSTGWKPASFDHGSTRFPLTGSHAAQPCQACHINGNYTLTYTDCWQCHQSDYTGALVPAHAAGQFPHDCTTCHTTVAWKPSTFNHSSTKFPLQGAHATKPCESCHVGGNYNLTYTDCWQCHQSNYSGTTNPNHTTGQFSHDCTTCHSMTAWKPATFDHSTTKFALQGAHAAQPCQACHINGNYNLTYTDCWQCHQGDYGTTASPSHASNQFPHDCLQCHTLTAWKPSTFNHANTKFALTGAHAAQPCSACHVNGNYALTYTDCWQCHQTDYNGAASPAHASNQFSHDCTKCHSMTAWQPSTFNHANTNFALQGAHTSLACSKCHINGNYNLTYTDCYQCHQPDYAGTSTPANHVALNLSHNCLTCHTQTAWNPATPFRTSHNVNAPVGFPIYGSVKHPYPGRWTNCNQCHTTNSTSAYCCTGCHSNQTSLANDHSGKPGYSFGCTTCTASGCHPDGRAP